jgi:hypothetical protein
LTTIEPFPKRGETRKQRENWFCICGSSRQEIIVDLADSGEKIPTVSAGNG